MRVVTRTLTDEVAELIKARIESGEFPQGQRLPSERVLVEQLGISRTVLRESLSGLEASGYVQAQVGKGRFVVDPQDRSKSETLITEWLRRHQAQFQDLVEMRALVEAQALRSSSATPSELLGLVEGIVKEQAKAVADGRTSDAAALDYEFHVRLTLSSTNRLLRALGVALIGRARQAALAAYSMRAYQAESMRQHERILAALAAGDLAAAADLISEHHLSRASQISEHLEARGRARGDW
jgi:GntR family transcriptional regulator, transcriptional repressor for pyruvate dehydrogenase complex